MAAVEVFYHASIGGNDETGTYFPKDLASLDLVPYEVNQEYPSARCPAQKEFWKNTWTCKTPFAIDMKFFHKQQKGIITNMDNSGANAICFGPSTQTSGLSRERHMICPSVVWRQYKAHFLYLPGSGH
jgi:hypothetical protein